MPIQPLLMNEHNGHLQSLDNHTQKKTHYGQIRTIEGSSSRTSNQQQSTHSSQPQQVDNNHYK